MRRVTFAVAATVLIAGAVPGAALARQHHHRHSARTHNARVRRFGEESTAPTSTSPSDNAGTVQSFENGALTIALHDGSTVKGAVTNDTELECMAPEQSSNTVHEDGDGGSGDQSSGDGNRGPGDDQGDNNQNEDQNEDQNEANSCSTSNLTPTTVVHEASLRVGGSGAVWQTVELVVS